jgi:PIN domain nuclease of toxin-antitoxin system
MVLLDTHIWLWWLLGDGNLNNMQRRELDRLASDNSLSISWATIWETEMLERKGRIQLLPDFQSWIKLATRQDVVTVLPVDIELVIVQHRLPETFHPDPADRLITATSLLSGFPLYTRDQRIRESEICEIWDERSGV